MVKFIKSKVEIPLKFSRKFRQIVDVLRQRCLPMLRSMHALGQKNPVPTHGPYPGNLSKEGVDNVSGTNNHPIPSKTP
jgi:hypothetical protein